MPLYEGNLAILLMKYLELVETKGKSKCDWNIEGIVKRCRIGKISKDYLRITKKIQADRR